MNCRYDAVFLDFDGTIADTGEGIFSSVRYAIKESGFEPISNESLRTFIGPPIFDSFKRELNMTDEQSNFAVMKYREEYSRNGIFRFELYNGIEELIKELKASGIKVAIASSKPGIFVNRIIEFLKFEELIDFVSCPTTDKAHESKTSLVNAAVAHFGIDKSKVLMIGDRHFDINGANGAGVDSIGVTFGYGNEEELQNAGATYIAHDTEEIRRIIFS